MLSFYCRPMLHLHHYTHTHTHTHTHNHLWLSGFVRDNPGPGWAGTRRNIHPLTPIVVISHPLSDSSIYYDHGILPVQFTCLTFFFHNLSPSFLWSTSWPGTLNFIIHTLFHPIIVFFSQHSPIRNIYALTRYYKSCLQCFDTVGWVVGRASSL